jgi:hypothetical protein
MSTRSTLLAATLILSSFGTAQADGIKPIQAQSIDLGGVLGSAYYTVEQNGFRVVSTLSQGETGTPVRMVAVLTPGQRVLLSTASGVGSEPVEVEISREADTLVVRKAALAY